MPSRATRLNLCRQHLPIHGMIIESHELTPEHHQG